jgi:ankyrin repeat protein
MSDELIVAISNGKFDTVKEMLADRTDLNYLYKCQSDNIDKEVTPLHVAAGTGNVELIKLLLSKGADPKKRSAFGRIPLSVAASFGHLEACKELLSVSDLLLPDNSSFEAYSNAERGIRSAKTDARKTRCQKVKDFLRVPTFIAALKGNNTDLVTKMIKENVDFKEAFITACNEGDLDVVDKMLKNNYVNIEDKYFLEAYGNVKRNIDNATTDERKKVFNEIKDFLRIYTFVKALRGENNGLINKMIEDEINLAEIFVTACKEGDLDIIDKMLKNNYVDINVYYKGWTGLQSACFYGRRNIILKLLKYPELEIDAQVKGSKQIGYTSLHCACLSSTLHPLQEPVSKEGDDQSIRMDIVKDLISHHANINLIADNEVTAIHVAIMYNQLDIVKLLVKNGANLRVRIQYPDDILKKYPIDNKNFDNYGGNLLSFSINRPEIYEFLQEAIQEHYPPDAIDSGILFWLNYRNHNVKPSLRFDDESYFKTNREILAK